MMFIAALMVFCFSAMVTSALAYSERGWRYAMGFTVSCAVLLDIWSADLLQRLMRATLGAPSPTAALALAALPFGVVLIRLWHRRIHTPRHKPGPDDDPVLRRYLEEKLRRLRKRRQEEELVEGRDDPTSRGASGL